MLHAIVVTKLKRAIAAFCKESVSLKRSTKSPSPPHSPIMYGRNFRTGMSMLNTTGEWRT